MLVSADQDVPVVPLPIALTVNVLDASGAVVGTFDGSATTFQVSVLAPGTFTLGQTYSIEVHYELPGSAIPFVATFGPFPGSALAAPGAPQVLVLQVNDFPGNVGGKITITNADGSPGAGYWTNIGIFVPEANGVPAAETDQGLGGVTDASGVVPFSGPVTQLNSSATYQVDLLVYTAAPADGGTEIGSFTTTTSGAELSAGSFSWSVNMAAITPPPTVGTPPHGRITPPGHGKRT